MNKIIETKIDKINELRKQMNVLELFEFGSVCTPLFNNESDIDILVTFNNINYEKYAASFFDLADNLEALFGRKVDLVTTKSLSIYLLIQYINRKFKSMNKNINQIRQTIFEFDILIYP